MENLDLKSGKFQALSDGELYQKCKEYGGNARAWMKKFAGLLPEVYRRKLYKRRGCASVHEFAAKLAGMSHDTVNRILKLEQKLKDKPILLAQLETGEVSWAKLEIVAPVATKETDESFSEKTKLLTRPALQEYVKQNQPLYMVKSFAGEGFESQKITVPMPLNPKTKSRLDLLKQKIEKAKGMAMSWDEIMEEILRECEENEALKKIVAGKKVITKEVTTNICPECTQKKENEREKNREVTRYIPVDPQKIIQKRSGGICEFQGCSKVGEIYHHVRRFAIKKNHDPNFIRFLCKGHEGILQMGLVENEEMEPRFWRMRDEAPWYDLKNQVDQRVAEFRREPAIKLAFQ